MKPMAKISVKRTKLCQSNKKMPKPPVVGHTVPKKKEVDIYFMVDEELTLFKLRKNKRDDRGRRAAVKI